MIRMGRTYNTKTCRDSRICIYMSNNNNFKNNQKSTMFTTDVKMLNCKKSVVKILLLTCKLKLVENYVLSQLKYFRNIS